MGNPHEDTTVDQRRGCQLCTTAASPMTSRAALASCPALHAPAGRLQHLPGQVSCKFVQMCATLMPRNTLKHPQRHARSRMFRGALLVCHVLSRSTIVQDLLRTVHTAVSHILKVRYSHSITRLENYKRSTPPTLEPQNGVTSPAFVYPCLHRRPAGHNLAVTTANKPLREGIT